MGVNDGTPVDAATTNPAFLDANQDDTALGKISLNNAVDPGVSGPMITNIQRELNSESSYTGKPTNIAKDALPVWVDPSVGGPTNNLTQRIEALTEKFNSVSGHAHSPAAGQGAPIQAQHIANVPLKGFGVRATDLTGVTGGSHVVTTQMTGKFPSALSTVAGVVVVPPYNFIPLRNPSTNNPYEDGSGNQVFGRLTESAGVWTLTFFVNLAGVETAYSFSGSVSVAWWFQELWNPLQPLSPVYSEMFTVPSLNAAEDVPDASVLTRGLVNLTAQEFLGEKYQQLRVKDRMRLDFQTIADGATYDPITLSSILVVIDNSTSTPTELRGIDTIIDGQKIEILNLSTAIATVKHNLASSGYPFLLPDASDVEIPQNVAISFTAKDGAWNIAGGAPGLKRDLSNIKPTNPGPYEFKTESSWFGSVVGWLLKATSGFDAFFGSETQFTTDVGTRNAILGTGNNMVPGAGASTGYAWVTSGAVTDPASTGGSGPCYVSSGDVNGFGNSGGFFLYSGTAHFGSSGSFQANTGWIQEPTGTGNTGELIFNVGSNFGFGSTGQLYFQGGDILNSSNSNDTGRLYFKTGNTFGTGNTGYFLFSTGVPTTGNSGQMTFETGYAANGSSGGLSFSSGGVGAGSSGNIQFNSGPTSGGTSGSIDFNTGGGGGASGPLNFNTGGASGTSGSMNFLTGSGGTSGGVTFETGTASGGNSGDITFRTGTATGTRGKIKIQDGSEGTIGHVWTSTGVNGEGTWAAGGGGGGANASLSNLTNPTSINQDLLPDVGDTRSVGTLGTIFNQGFFKIIKAVNPSGSELRVSIDANNATSPSGVGVGSGSIIFNPLGATNGLITTRSDAAVSAAPSATILIETGNRTGGTGNSGSLKLQTGTSAGGLRGEISLNGRQVNVNSTKIVNVTDPTAAQDAATKAYVDSKVVPAASAISALDIDWALSETYYKSISVNSTFTFSNLVDGKSITVALTNTSGGAVTVAFPTVVKRTDFPTSIPASKSNVYVFTRMNGVTYASGTDDMA